MGRYDVVKSELDKTLERDRLDVLTLTDPAGIVIYRSSNPRIAGDSEAGNEVVAAAIAEGRLVSATDILNHENLARAGGGLAERARIRIVSTPHARARPESVETSGMMMEAAAPILAGDGRMLGVLYGGRLLNRDYGIVDTVKDIVYRGEQYRGKETGTATIFQGDLRIATNVMMADGERAVGTTVSREVYDQVIVRGVPWVARAFVVNDWYITAYEPIRDLKGEVVGMLYVGLLEAPYRDLRNRVILTLVGIAAATVLGASLIVIPATSSITKPLRDLVHGTEEVARGRLSYRVPSGTGDELGVLADSFNRMTADLEKATERYMNLTHTLEDKVKERTRQLEQAQDQLVRSEKLTSLGKLAAGIAHEINNPLTSVLINGHLLAEMLEGRDDVQENLGLIIGETTRCADIVRGLLEFSRQTSAEKRTGDINQLVRDTLLLVKSNILASKVEVRQDLAQGLPAVLVDVNKMKQVFTNIILNALDAMPEGGTLAISTRLGEDGSRIEIGFRDTGVGIAPDVIGRIFDPFFTTKGVSGTGLGLSISYGIVEQHGGRIDVESEPGNGTNIIVKLPLPG